MIKIVETTGKTTDEAVAAALRLLSELNPDITASDVEVELLERARSGFLGIGSVNAKVRVSYELPPVESAKAFLSGLLERMGVSCFVDGSMTDDGISLNITGENMGVVIGRRGDTLDALQYITSIVTNKGVKEHLRVTVDTENYRKKREESLETLAHKVAGRVLKYKKSVTLEPMNANERRVIHSALQGTRGISTYSMGSEPNRRVVVSLAGARTPRSRGPRGERAERVNERAGGPQTPPVGAAIPKA
jgi:spoIIIJ-associated protein